MALIRRYPDVHEAYLGLSMWFTAEASKVLTPYLSPGQTLVLLGSSGTGKSTLTNSLLGSATQDTGGVREHDSRGKHTSTARSLHLLPTGACVIDTPGVRTLRPDVDAQTLSALFEDVSTPMPRRVVFETAVIRTSPAAWCR